MATTTARAPLPAVVQDDHDARRARWAAQRDAFHVTGAINLGCRGPWSVEQFVVTSEDSLLAVFNRQRVEPGAYTRLLYTSPGYSGRRRAGQGALWMSDTPDEYRDHARAVHEATGRVLVNGLGLGCVLRAMLVNPAVTHVDVVERDSELVALMQDLAPWMADPRVHVHVADAYEQARAWPRGTTWDVAWHDIWLNICADDLPGHTRLLRSYARRTGWQGAWRHEYLQSLQRRGW